jgi:hypothetical protein
MAGTLSFVIDTAFKEMVDQAVKAKKPLMLVKDQGVYLMAGGKTAKDNKVVYARGLDPNKDDFDTWYDKAHRICGGDDFGENIPTDFFSRAVAGGAKTLKVKLTATRMSLEASR